MSSPVCELIGLDIFRYSDIGKFRRFPYCGIKAKSPLVIGRLISDLPPADTVPNTAATSAGPDGSANGRNR